MQPLINRFHHADMLFLLCILTILQWEALLHSLGSTNFSSSSKCTIQLKHIQYVFLRPVSRKLCFYVAFRYEKGLQLCWLFSPFIISKIDARSSMPFSSNIHMYYKTLFPLFMFPGLFCTMLMHFTTYLSCSIKNCGNIWLGRYRNSTQLIWWFWILSGS